MDGVSDTVDRLTAVRHAKLRSLIQGLSVRVDTRQAQTAATANAAIPLSQRNLTLVYDCPAGTVAMDMDEPGAADILNGLPRSAPVNVLPDNRVCVPQEAQRAYKALQEDPTYQQQLLLKSSRFLREVPQKSPQLQRFLARLRLGMHEEDAPRLQRDAEDLQAVERRMAPVQSGRPAAMADPDIDSPEDRRQRAMALRLRQAREDLLQRQTATAAPEAIAGVLPGADMQLREALDKRDLPRPMYAAFANFFGGRSVTSVFEGLPSLDKFYVAAIMQQAVLPKMTPYFEAPPVDAEGRPRKAALGATLEFSFQKHLPNGLAQGILWPGLASDMLPPNKEFKPLVLVPPGEIQLYKVEPGLAPIAGREFSQTPYPTPMWATYAAHSIVERCIEAGDTQSATEWLSAACGQRLEDLSGMPSRNRRFMAYYGCVYLVVMLLLQPFMPAHIRDSLLNRILLTDRAYYAMPMRRRSSKATETGMEVIPGAGPQGKRYQPTLPLGSRGEDDEVNVEALFAVDDQKLVLPTWFNALADLQLMANWYAHAKPMDHALRLPWPTWKAHERDLLVLANTTDDDGTMHLAFGDDVVSRWCSAVAARCHWLTPLVSGRSSLQQLDLKRSTARRGRENLAATATSLAKDALSDLRYSLVLYAAGLFPIAQTPFAIEGIVKDAEGNVTMGEITDVVRQREALQAFGKDPNSAYIVSKLLPTVTPVWLEALAVAMATAESLRHGLQMELPRGDTFPPEYAALRPYVVLWDASLDVMPSQTSVFTDLQLMGTVWYTWWFQAVLQASEVYTPSSLRWTYVRAGLQLTDAVYHEQRRAMKEAEARAMEAAQQQLGQDEASRSAWDAMNLLAQAKTHTVAMKETERRMQKVEYAWRDKQRRKDVTRLQEFHRRQAEKGFHWKSNYRHISGAAWFQDDVVVDDDETTKAAIGVLQRIEETALRLMDTNASAALLLEAYFAPNQRWSLQKLLITEPAAEDDQATTRRRLQLLDDLERLSRYESIAAEDTMSVTRPRSMLRELVQDLYFTPRSGDVRAGSLQNLAASIMTAARHDTLPVAMERQVLLLWLKFLWPNEDLAFQKWPKVRDFMPPPTWDLQQDEGLSLPCPLIPDETALSTQLAVLRNDQPKDASLFMDLLPAPDDGKDRNTPTWAAYQSSLAVLDASMPRLPGGDGSEETLATVEGVQRMLDACTARILWCERVLAFLCTVFGVMPPEPEGLLFLPSRLENEHAAALVEVLAQLRRALAGSQTMENDYAEDQDLSWVRDWMRPSCQTNAQDVFRKTMFNNFTDAFPKTVQDFPHEFLILMQAPVPQQWFLSGHTRAFPASTDLAVLELYDLVTGIGRTLGLPATWAPSQTARVLSHLYVATDRDWDEPKQLRLQEFLARVFGEEEFRKDAGSDFVSEFLVTAQDHVLSLIMRVLPRDERGLEWANDMFSYCYLSTPDAWEFLSSKVAALATPEDRNTVLDSFKPIRDFDARWQLLRRVLLPDEAAVDGKGAERKEDPGIRPQEDALPDLEEVRSFLTGAFGVGSSNRGTRYWSYVLFTVLWRLPEVSFRLHVLKQFKDDNEQDSEKKGFLKQGRAHLIGVMKLLARTCADCYWHAVQQKTEWFTTRMLRVTAAKTFGMVLAVLEGEGFKDDTIVEQALRQMRKWQDQMEAPDMEWRQAGDILIKNPIAATMEAEEPFRGFTDMEAALASKTDVAASIPFLQRYEHAGGQKSPQFLLHSDGKLNTSILNDAGVSRGLPLANVDLKRSFAAANIHHQRYITQLLKWNTRSPADTGASDVTSSLVDLAFDSASGQEPETKEESKDTEDDKEDGQEEEDDEEEE
jgi:hypothetical protein